MRWEVNINMMNWGHPQAKFCQSNQKLEWPLASTLMKAFQYISDHRMIIDFSRFIEKSVIFHIFKISQTLVHLMLCI